MASASDDTSENAAASEQPVSLTPAQTVLYDVYLLDTIFSFLSSPDIVSLGRTCRTALTAKRSYLRRAEDDNRRISLFFPSRPAFRKLRGKLGLTTPRTQSFDDAYRSNTYRLIVNRAHLHELGTFLESVGYTLRRDSRLGQLNLDQVVRRMRMPMNMAEGRLDGVPPRAIFGEWFYDRIVNDETFTVVLDVMSLSRGIDLLL
ncbi:unnamed protein product [Peniophora sp. CBMAI 1063]|nr:unnamed protein product [Peniophora sp. CBMAI 1063]